MKVSWKCHYDSAHYLTGVPEGHKCSRLHGHTYELTATVDGPVGEDGFVIDFADIKTAVAPLIDQLDHRLLNDIIDNPTVERQLVWLWERIDLPGLCELRLQEGVKNAAVYTGPTR